MESVNSRKFIKDYEIKENKIIKTFGTGEIKEVENTKANLTRLKNDITKQIEEFKKEEKYTRFNKRIFSILIVFFAFSFVSFFLYCIFAASRTDILAVILGGLICILSMTLFLVSKEYNKLNTLHRSYINEAAPFINKLEEKWSKESGEKE